MAWSGPQNQPFASLAVGGAQGKAPEEGSGGEEKFLNALC